MRLEETDGEEERLARFRLRRLQAMNRFLRNLPIGISVVRHIGRFVRSATRQAPGVLIGEERFLTGESLVGPALGFHVGDRFLLKVRHTPRRRVFAVAVADVKNLSQRLGAVAVLLEILRQRHRVRRGLAEVRPEIVNAQRGRPHAGEQRIARRRAHGLIAIRALEHHAASREPVDIRRLHNLVAVAAEHGLQIIDRYEKDVGLLGGVGRAMQ